MTHLGGLREERKAVLLVTRSWLLHQPNPSSHRVWGAGAALFDPPVKPPSERGPFNNSELRECEADIQALANLDHDLRFRDITDEANRGNVTFYPVYARGLTVFDAPIGPDKPPPILQDLSNLRTRHNNMRTLAVDTDGEAVINTNLIEQALKRIADDLSSYCLLVITRRTTSSMAASARSLCASSSRASAFVRGAVRAVRARRSRLPPPRLPLSWIRPAPQSRGR